MACHSLKRNIALMFQASENRGLSFIGAEHCKSWLNIANRGLSSPDLNIALIDVWSLCKSWLVIHWSGTLHLCFKPLRIMAWHSPEQKIALMFQASANHGLSFTGAEHCTWCFKPLWAASVNFEQGIWSLKNGFFSPPSSGGYFCIFPSSELWLHRLLFGNSLGWLTANHSMTRHRTFSTMHHRLAWTIFASAGIHYQPLVKAQVRVQLLPLLPNLPSFIAQYACWFALCGLHYFLLHLRFLWNLFPPPPNTSPLPGNQCLPFPLTW